MSLEEAYKSQICPLCENQLGCPKQLNIIHDEDQHLDRIRCAEYVRIGTIKKVEEQ